MNILARNGSAQIRRRGSHVVMQKNVGDFTVTVIVPDHREVCMGTLSSIVRQSQLPRDAFEP
jgi:predicted RNA binding protein YcfA (HicA-like mRNA interferase family)